MTGLPDRVAVIGGGRMGVGIAHAFAALGATVTVSETGDLGAARKRLTDSLSRAAERGKLVDPLGVVADRVAFVASVAELPGDARLLVEAVPEDPGLKMRVLADAERIVSDDAVIATNTSSLSPTELGAALRNPSRFLGMHFFNPVPASELVEIVRADTTSDALVRDVAGWVELLGKTPVVVRDSPGFATSRLGVLLGLEAIRMLEEGVADAESIDRAMELGYKHPMGPLRSTDLVGLDVRLAVAEYLHGALGERFAPPQLLRDKVARGELGRKSGRGFYDWS
ncbi:3-hydroxyacyl-CoA dehydrogenase family protein [Rhodococcus rhodochrous]|uniref:3-hydroxybutyryl-CoA dehydrogenase n=1 Tax=Rhodococcus rhodochrous KG-21 TaxID=1441923 RepID=A0A0M9WNV4_RHORH|nr:3-hydroxyacyl-CoA dehydrogenase family protein [Rhodococcus rhodochrous]KOS55981.1 3-hydroxybutyryl-CoA dehydrogenase [Rhodococcus rhodochrous KG-21]